MLDRVILKNGNIARWETHSWSYKYHVGGETLESIYCCAKDGGGGLYDSSSQAGFWCMCWDNPLVEITGAELEALWGEKGYVTPHELDEFAMMRKYGRDCDGDTSNN